jgi:hypothetical protein
VTGAVVINPLETRMRDASTPAAPPRTSGETRGPAGLFRVCNTRSERWYIGASLDVPAALARQRFRLETGAHPNSALQRDWKRLGAFAFAFETLCLLAPSADPARDPRKELRRLESEWRDRLTALYGAGYHEDDVPGV